MYRKVFIVAFALAAAAPVSAAAQSSLTLSGFFKVGIEHYSIGDAVNRANSSEMRLTDNTSRIIFAVSEDLDGGLSAIAQLETRFNPTAVGGSTWGSGNTWVGLHSNQWGSITLGNHDLHYYHTGDTIPDGAAAVDAWSVGILGFVNARGGKVNSAIASDTRTPNVVEYSSPQWGLFGFSAAWSANRAGSPSDMGAPGATPAIAGLAGTGGPVTRKGNAWNFAPQVRGGNWVAGYSYWNSKADPLPITIANPAGTEPDQRGDRLWGYYKFSQGLYIGLTWDKSRLNDASTGTLIAQRRAWSLPLAYGWGAHSVGYTYTRAQDDDVFGSGTGAKLNAIYYQYAMSKRTQVGVTYANLSNDANAAYNLYDTNLGSTDVVTLAPGEKPRALQLTLKHSS